MKQLLLLLVLLVPACLHGQTMPVVPIPQLPVIRPPQPPNPYQSLSPGSNGVSIPDVGQEQIERRNREMINEAMGMAHESALRERLKSDIAMLSTRGFPSQADQEGAASFYSAFKQIDSMLQGKTMLDLGKAVFLVENAYYGNTLNYAEYEKSLDDKIKFCRQKIKEERLDPESNLVKNMMLFRFVSDTLQLKSGTKGHTITHFPIKYDLDDYKSEKNFDSHFVTKLMRSGSGQCYSMPLYYLVLAEKIGAKAYWSFSPRHTFVKIQDEDKAWYNLELTCGAILSDAHYMNSSYIKAEAIRNRIYLEPMEKKEIVAEMLIGLARNYYQRFGMDNFYLDCANAASLYLKNQLDPLTLKSIYETRLTLTLAHLLQAPKPEIMKEKYPDSYKHYENMLNLYARIDSLGYEETPADVYANWLKHIDKLKAERSNRKIFIGIGKTKRIEKR